MIKAVFIDYTGTILQFRGKDYDEMLTRFVEHSQIKTREEAFQWYMDHLRLMERDCYGDNFLTEEEIIDKLLVKAEDEVKLREDHTIMHTLMQNFWMYAPLYSDEPEFLSVCTLPVYILMDNNSGYAKVCLRRNNLHAYGVISGEDVRAYKPRVEIFNKALEMAGCQPEEVIHVGDDLEGDIQGALNAGITPVLIDRRSEHRDAKCRRVRSLIEVLPYINRENTGK